MTNKLLPTQLTALLSSFKCPVFHFCQPANSQRFNLLKFFLLSIFIFAAQHSNSQKLTFCEGIDKTTGMPSNASDQFTIASDGGFLILLVTMPKGINSATVTYDIFRLNADNSETFESTIRQNVFPEYTWFSKQITFHQASKYNVYVYDDKDLLLCVGRVTIKMN